MEVAFQTRALRAICEDEDEANRQLGAEVAESLKHRLADLCAARSPNELLAGRPRLSRDGRNMRVDLRNGQVLVFKANHPKLDSDDIDWSAVSRIKVMGIQNEDA